MNVKLLRKIKQRILRKPNRFDMNHWFSRTRKYYGFTEQLSEATHNPKEFIEECGTAACIAGWACILGEGSFMFSCEDEARRLLNLTFHQSQRLFLEQGWPAEFRASSSESNEQRAMRAAKRIDHFIATNGRE